MTMFFLVLLFMVLLETVILEGTVCNDNNCNLPDCFCSGYQPPAGMSPSSIPQFIMISFNGAINENNYEEYSKIFHNERLNPNGCPIRGTFFVTQEWNDNWLTQNLYAAGHEIADHSVTLEALQPYKKADIDRWVKEIGGMKKTLELFSEIAPEDIQGFRAPFLQPGGDIMVDAIVKSGLSYDSSLPARENDPPIWPYTLDFKSIQNCQVGPCPEKSHPGVWEVPLVHLNSFDGRRCAIVDACQDRGYNESASDFLFKNFWRHYNGNRAPFPLNMHIWHKMHPYRTQVFHDFLDMILMLPDVYVVPIIDVIDWIRNPIPCKFSNSDMDCSLKEMANWSCTRDSVLSRRPPCPKSQMQTCVLKREVNGVPRDRKLMTCETCPPEMPWLGNPDGRLLEARLKPIPSSEAFLWFAPEAKT